MHQSKRKQFSRIIHLLPGLDDVTPFCVVLPCEGLVPVGMPGVLVVEMPEGVVDVGPDGDDVLPAGGVVLSCGGLVSVCVLVVEVP